MRLTLRSSIVALGCVAHSVFAVFCAATLLDWMCAPNAAACDPGWSYIACCIAGFLCPFALLLAAWPTAGGRFVYGVLVTFVWADLGFSAWLAPIPKMFLFADVPSTVSGLILFGVPVACILSLSGPRRPSVPASKGVRGRVLVVVMALTSVLLLGLQWVTMDDFLRGVHYAQNGARACRRMQWETAERQLSKAIPLLPGDAYPLNLRGRARAECGNAEGALEDFRAAAQHDRTGEAQLLLGITLWRKEDQSGAREALTVSAELGGTSEYGRTALEHLRELGE